MILTRHLSGYLRKILKKFPVISLTGPRQSGKTTLLRNFFTDYKYYNLERLDIREIISADILGFLRQSGPRVIFDEAQNLPELFSYIQVISDEQNKKGQYILSGSQSFLLNESISQSLAGRVSVNVLLPFDIKELKGQFTTDPDSNIITGFYPRIHDQKIEPSDFYPSYLQTYIERDIRTLRSIGNLQTFSRFLGLCAGRIGQVLNLTSLANDAGISVNTAKAWLSLLESSYIIYLLQPYYNNFNKRIIKTPKLYFYDTGVASSLLRIGTTEALRNHYLYGSLFENLVISEIIKSQVHSGRRASVYYWRESNGTEIDCIVERPDGGITAIEIKAGQTFTNGFLRNLLLFPEKTVSGDIQKFVVYKGSETTTIRKIKIVSWNDCISGESKLM
jgi:predicted AAA+ superfamily ATPase